MKSKRTLFILLMVMAASLLMVAAVSADSLSGAGWLNAQGDGLAALRGYARTVELSGDGSLWYRDGGEVDVPTVTGNGRRIEYANGWVQYVGFDGDFSVSDADQFTVILRGKNIDLFADGQGRVYLKGEGSYVIGHEEGEIEGTWLESGITLTLAPDK